MDEETFTYATLRKIERMENTQPRLQKLESRFWERLGDHLERLRGAFHQQQEEDPTSRRTVVLADELRNTQRLAENIWSLREKKVVQAALAATRRAEGRVEPPDFVTDEERALWERSIETFSNVRREVLKLTQPGGRTGSKPLPAGEGAAHTAKTGQPATTAPPATAGPAGVQESEAISGTSSQGTPSTPAAPTREVPASAHAPATEEGAPAGGPGVGASPPPQADDQGGAGTGGAGEDQVALRLVWALEEVPLFTGPDMVNYRLARGEVGNIPAKAATILEERGVVRILPEGTDVEALQEAEVAPEP